MWGTALFLDTLPRPLMVTRDKDGNPQEESDVTRFLDSLCFLNAGVGNSV
jgi:hypothetical protein